jgi:uncharacterized protein YyaL (SSP411 family)
LAKNRLAGESSPYLLLHADNPVDWHPWGEEAFEKAVREDKPIFLSVGYSTCYWCHVMERESFSDPQVARQLNEGFVSIKLDREERPDLDEVYMAATQLITGSGGWPNSLFLTHELTPFYAGTYFPPRDGHGRPGFSRLLAAIREAWDERPEEVAAQAQVVGETMRDHLSAAPAGAVPDPAIAEEAQTALSRRFDARWGGFGGAPKFPSPSNLFFLLERAREGDGPAREMVLVTLDRMARGGIHDQLGGGFHRYSTDAFWLVPHFEKMLYDNAALAALYAGAHSLDAEAGFADVARSTLEFVLRELTGEEGGFLSAIDAETGGHEGAYYTWTREELEAALPTEDHALLAAVYGFDGRPQLEGDRYVLHLPAPLTEQARARGLSRDQLRERLRTARQKLLEARGDRPRPLVDDKVLADWNGLMITAMVAAGEQLGEKRFLDAGRAAAEFVLSRMRDPASGILLHAYREGKARVAAFLDDYAFLVEGLLALHAASGEGRWLAEAVRLAGEQERRLGDAGRGGYFAAGEDPRLLVRAKPGHDGAVASGNGIAALNLIELGRRTGDPSFPERAEATLAALGGAASRVPLAHVTLVRALGRLPRRAPAAPPGAEATSRLEDEAREAVEVTGRLEPAGADWRPFVVELAIKPGWHVGANPAGEPSLVATGVEAVLGALRDLRYPEGEAISAGEGARVYRGHVRIEGELRPPGTGAPAVQLTYQACDESRCLPPLTRLVRLK